MTPQEINEELERFKDRVNADGKATLDRLKDALVPYLTPTVAVDVPVEPTKEVEVSDDRREEVRDLMEHEQHRAEELGYAPKERR